MQHPTVSYQTSTAVPGDVLGLDAAGLRQCDTGQPTTYTTGQIAVCAQCCGTSGVAYSSRKYDHITPLLHELHWQRVPGCIYFRLAVLFYRCLHGHDPQYLTAELHCASDRDTGRRMRSSLTASLIVPWTKHSTIGDRAFSVAAVRLWNSISPTVTSATSLLTFKKRLKAV